MTKEKTKKPRIAIISLTSCEGCQFVLLDQGKRMFDFLSRVEVDEFRLIEDNPIPPGKFDICIIEGNPITKENFKILREMRERSKMLIVMGNCAALGGVWEMGNYHLNKKTIKNIYKEKGHIKNPDIREVNNFVKVDFVIPGCPINGDEAIEILNQILVGRIPSLPQEPVCHECQNKGYECLLQKGEICLGPITLGGCQAVCLKSKQACWGCRGLFEGAQAKNLMSHLQKNFTREQIYRVMEVFGTRDTIMEYLEGDKKATKPKNKSAKK